MTPELRALVADIAKKYKLRLSMQLGEAVMSLFDIPVEEKQSVFLHHLKNELATDKVNLVVIHAARAHPEMQVLVDMNNPVMNTKDMEPLTALHRKAELEMLLSPEVEAAFKQQNVKFINYHDLDNPFAK